MRQTTYVKMEQEDMINSYISATGVVFMFWWINLQERLENRGNHGRNIKRIFLGLYLIYGVPPTLRKYTLRQL